MPPCLCAPTSHKGSFRCRLHRAAVRRVPGDRGSRSTVNQASGTVFCLCAPTCHPGSFRCHLHRSKEPSSGGRSHRPSAHAKFLPPAKSGDSFARKKAALARTNRALSESKLRSEQTKAMPEIVAAVEELRITTVEIDKKKGKAIAATVPATSMARASNSVTKENSVLGDAVSVKGPKETINVLRSQNKGTMRPTTAKERRLRAKSDLLLATRL